MAMLNVNREVNDSFYRYKMPKLIAKVEGRGNGIKTVIPNMSDIAKALDRPPGYPTKFFGCELGAQTIMDDKNDRYVVNGAFQADTLQDHLDGFIKKFVLCPQCANPETRIKVTKSKDLETKCGACGYRGILKTNHKLVTYIISHPPDGADKDKKKKKKDKEERKDKKKDRKKSKSDDTAPGSQPSPSSESSSTKSPKRAVVTAEEQEDMEEMKKWSVDTSEDARRKRAAAALGSAALGALTLTDDLDKTIDERLDIFRDFIRVKKSEPKFAAKAVLGEAQRLECKEKGVRILAEELFDANIGAQITTFAALFQRFVFDNEKAQRYLLGGLEVVIHRYSGLLLDKTPGILKKFYDSDILDEDVIINWSEKSTKKYVDRESNQLIREKAGPFCEWLREADNDDESDEEEDDTLRFDDNAQSGLVESTASGDANGNAKEQKDDSDSDVDIEDI